MRRYGLARIKHAQDPGSADLRRSQEVSQKVRIHRTAGPSPSVEPNKNRLTRNSSSLPHAAKDGTEVTEMHHATHALSPPATLTPPPCIEAGATLQPRPVPSTHRGDGPTHSDQGLRDHRGRAPSGPVCASPVWATPTCPESLAAACSGELPRAACIFVARQGGCAARGTSRRAAGTGQHPCSFAGSVRDTCP